MNNQLTYILVTVSGPDRPGITSNLMKVLKDNQIEIYDIEQTVTHGCYL
ncbi:MAG: ACT domain-containing protein [Bacteriovoracaceae bacterium]